MHTCRAATLRSTAPTAFAGYSFHIAEAALVFANEVTIVFLFPIHAGLHRIYHLATTAIHIGAQKAFAAILVYFLNSQRRMQGLVNAHAI
jgi:hypothetical protein